MKKETKGSLILKTYENSSIQLKDIKLAVNAFFDCFIEALQEGKTVEIRGLGTFLFEESEKRRRYNFQKACVSTEQGLLQLKFKASKNLKLKVEHEDYNESKKREL